MFGEDPEAAGIPDLKEARAPLAALEQSVLPALERAPCLVSFSGGRDSSCVLAVAARAARREGLPAPIPVTLRVRDAPMADESAWQEQVVRHLGLRDWELREAGEELERLGPLSVSVLERHGVLYPPNPFLQIPLLEAARGGCLLSGLGGDELFASWRWRNHADALARRRRAAPLDALRLANAASPAALRRRRERRRYRLRELVWLRPEAASLASQLAADARAEQPRTWSRWVDWFARRRALRAPPLAAGGRRGHRVRPSAAGSGLHGGDRQGWRARRVRRPHGGDARRLRRAAARRGALAADEGALQRGAVGVRRQGLRHGLERRRGRQRACGRRDAEAGMAEAEPARGQRHAHALGLAASFESAPDLDSMKRPLYTVRAASPSTAVTRS
jgi:hypothetical protein